MDPKKPLARHDSWYGLYPSESKKEHTDTKSVKSGVKPIQKTIETTAVAVTARDNDNENEVESGPSKR